jgi:chemotaxis protein MotB
MVVGPVGGALVSSVDTEEGRREIVIVRRGGNDHEDGHHGGVWKIAFADFMTAMMCFFLVMWLVNAANEQTKAAVASYFNPLSLVEPIPSGSGVDDPGDQPRTRDEDPAGGDQVSTPTQGARDELSGPGQFANSRDQLDTHRTSDQHLFADPYAVLSEIAAETGTLQNVSAAGEGGAQQAGPSTGAHGGESYRDPFAPDFWSSEVSSADTEELDVFREPSPPPAPTAEPMLTDIVPAEAEQDDAAQFPVELSASQPEGVAAEAEPDARDPQETQMAALPSAEAPAEPGETADATARPAQGATPGEPVVSTETREIAERIRDEIDEAFGDGDELNRTISVEARAEGVMISVTDELNYGMFEIGSAVPQRELVLAMEKIAAALTAQQGSIRINGHTDARPFRTEAYDNWRLSTARAHSAYYMLVRTGLDERRIREVAGFADRDLKVPEDPNADANRRIEIFLETAR